MSRGLIRVSLMLTLALGLLSSASVSAQVEVAAATVHQQTTVEVHNWNWMDVNVFAVTGTRRVRLGFVTSMNTARLKLPDDVAQRGEIKIYIDPIGSLDGFTTDPLLVRPGQNIELSVQGALNLTSYSVW